MNYPPYGNPGGRTGADDISEAHSKKQKPPKKYKNPLEARCPYLLEILSHNFLQKAEVIDCAKSL
jgi:hypothetical protein